MAEKPNVTVIPVSIEFMQNDIVSPNKKRKVAAYARVSTDSDEQEQSYNSQCKYYTKYIQARSKW